MALERTARIDGSEQPAQGLRQDSSYNLYTRVQPLVTEPKVLRPPDPLTGGTALDSGPSPNYVQMNSDWDQGFLAKSLLQMKHGEFTKLRFADGCYKPYEYEKWIHAITRVLTAMHPEHGKTGRE